MQPVTVLSISDTHFGLLGGVDDPVSGLNTRSMDGFHAFDQTIDYAINNNIKLIVHSGDVFNSKIVGQNVLNAFYERVAKLSQAGIFFYVLQGNHDSNLNMARKNGLDVAKTIDIPHTYFTRGNDYLDLEYIQIVSLSYWNTPDSAVEYLDKAAKQVDWNRPVILVGHLEVNYPGSVGAFKDPLSVMPLEVLTKHKWNFVQLGHIHKPMTLNESPKVFYTGSLVRCTFTEEEDTKGFWLNTITGNKLVMKQVEYDCLKMLTIENTMDEIKELLAGVKPEKFKNTLVRVIIKNADEVIDDKFLKEKFSKAFKFVVKKESKKKEHIKIDTTNLLSLNSYAGKYFEKHDRKKELLALVEEIKNIDDLKGAI